ncbi:MAG: hypothetical protein N2169_07845, partial [bacterium]|nr:hypothetical protein [bacterium]
AYAAVYSLNQNFINDYFEIHTVGGVIQKETAIHNGNGISLKFNCLDSSRDNRLSTFVYLPQGAKIKVSAYIMKTTSYNGAILPRIIIKGYFTDWIYKEMPNINNVWQKVELTATVKDSEMIEIGIGGRGTGPAIFYLDPRIYIEVNNKFTVTDFSQRHKFANVYNSNNNYGIILNGVGL